MPCAAPDFSPRHHDRPRHSNVRHSSVAHQRTDWSTTSVGRGLVDWSTALSPASRIDRRVDVAHRDSVDDGNRLASTDSRPLPPPPDVSTAPQSGFGTDGLFAGAVGVHRPTLTNRRTVAIRGSTEALPDTAARIRIRTPDAVRCSCAARRTGAERPAGRTGVAAREA